MPVNRREFIVAAGAIALTAILPAEADAHGARRKRRKKHKHRPRRKARAHHTIFRLTVRGRRTSRVAKVFCANMRFKTRRAAATYPRPHPGINARVVPLDVSINEFHRLFIGGHTHAADLRHLRGLKVIGAHG